MEKPKDPRSKNKVFEGASVGEYFDSYVRAIQSASATVSRGQLNKAYQLLKENVKKGGRIYVAGNGESASTSDHLCCDFSKGARSSHGVGPRTFSLVSNVSLFSALSNDYGYEHSISSQVEYFMDSKDILILISSSGNSPNIVRALEKAKEKSIPVIGLSGFKGGKLKTDSDVPLHVDFENYGVVEDVHQSIMHAFSQFLAGELDRGL